MGNTYQNQLNISSFIPQIHAAFLGYCHESRKIYPLNILWKKSLEEKFHIHTWLLFISMKGLMQNVP